MSRTAFFCLLLQLLTLLHASQINEPVSLAVTIYNDNFAIVKDVRSISFDQNRSDLYFTDVSSNIQTETVTFKAIANPESIKVYEQNYEANLINTQSILQKYIDKEVVIYAKLGTTSLKVKGTLLGYNSGYILRTSAGIEVYNNIEGINFSSLPEGFNTLPTLNWKVFSESAVTTDCEVAYRTTGFSWKADYSVILSADETKADVGGWVTIDNYSGKRYLDAKLKLIAGDVNLVNNNQNVNPVQPVAMMSAASAAPTFSEKSFSDFHLYTLSEPVTLEENSQKQVEFIPKVYQINVRKYNLISVSSGGYAQAGLKASNKIEISNSQQNQLGIPLPKGTVRVFKEDDADGSLEFLGEDSIDHTPKDENVTLNTGNAFDISADKTASNYRSFSNSSGYDADLNLTIWNHKDIATEIVVEINNYYGDNNQFIWVTKSLNVEKVSAYLLRISRVFQPDEKASYLWRESYRR
jgi:hypothetical protein